MLAYSSIAHAGYLLAAFAGLGNDGIMAACFYIAAYAAMNVGIFAVVTLASGYDEKLPLIDDFRGLIYRSPLLGSLLIFFLASLVGIPFTGGILWQADRIFNRARRRSNLAGHYRLLNSGVAAAYYLRLALAAAQRLDEQKLLRSRPTRRYCGGRGPAAAVAATLVLGIIPGDVLRAAEAGAHTRKRLRRRAARQLMLSNLRYSPEPFLRSD